MSLRRGGWAARSLVLLCLPALCLAQRYTFKAYTEGLGNLDANCMLQDRAGFLWIGTESGLFRYDGSRFVEFGRGEGLPGMFVRAMHEDRSGRLWIGTTDGLAYSIGNGRFATVQYQGQDLVVGYGSTISSAPDGRVFASTNVGLFTLTKDFGRPWEARPFPNAKPLAGKAALGVVASEDGSVVFGCGDGLCQLSGDHLTTWGEAEGLPLDSWSCLLRKRNGELWVRGPKHIAVLLGGQEAF